MEEENNLLLFMNSYNEFKENFQNKLNIIPEKIESEPCYLISNNWIDLVLFYYKSYNNNKIYSSINTNKSNYFFPKENPIFYQNIYDSFNNIKKLKFINRNTMCILNYKKFKGQKLFNIYIGYKKIIIEDPENLKNSLLLSNPLDENEFNRTGILIQINIEKKEKIYESYLKDEYVASSRKKFYLDNKIDSNDNIRLKICIMLFYYEKYISNNFPLKKDEKYYLINHYWMNKFKRFIKYEEIYKILKIYEMKSRNEIDYSNLDINFYTQHFLNEFQDNFEKIENFEIMNKSYLKYEPLLISNIQNILYYSNCFFIDKKILDLMKKIVVIKTINYANISRKNNKIYLFFNNNINVGDLDNELIFDSKYIISYNSNLIFNEEKNIILNMNLSKYFIQNECSINRAGIQNLIKNNKNIGNLYILKFNKDYNDFKFKSVIIFPKNSNYKNKVNSKSLDNAGPKQIINKENIKANKKFNKEIFFLFFQKLYYFHIKKIKFKELINILNKSHNKKISENLEKQEEEKNKIQIDFESKLNQYKTENENLKKKLEIMDKKEKEKEKNIESLKDENQKLLTTNQFLENEKKKNNEKIISLETKEKEYNIKIAEYKEKEKQYIEQIYSLKEKLKKNEDKRDKINIYNISKNIKGLNDVGDINFMNSIIQCFNQTENLVYYFLKESNQLKMLNKEEYELSQAYLDIIEKLWNKNEESSFSPYHFRNVIISKNKLFRNANIDIIGEFIDVFLDEMHKELKNKNDDYNKKNLFNNLNINHNNKSFREFLERCKEEKSIISDLFFGYFMTPYLCLNCKNDEVYYNYEKFKHLSFPLEEILDTINSRNKNDDNCKLTLNDCFKITFKYNNLGKTKNIFCNNCQNLTKCRYESLIYQIPKILIIILKRDINSIFNIEFEFDEKMDITEYISNNINNSKIIYELYGVVTCNNKNYQNCHFFASCKNMVDKKWYRYDDIIVKNIDNFEKEVIKYEIPYILFYKNIGNDQK